MATIREDSQPDERTPLLVGQVDLLCKGPTVSLHSCDDDVSIDKQDNHYVRTMDSHDSPDWRKCFVLLLGAFLANSDSAIILAMFRQIASDFNEMDSGSWIVTSYILGLIIAHPLYGKLSDIFGRKPVLLLAYICCSVGGVLSASGFSFWGVLLGRAFAGFGSAGITVLVSTLIVDLVPLRDVAVWRGYAYALNQLGRAIGPSLGGIIMDKFSWRWALAFPVPFHVLSIIVIWATIALPSPAITNTDARPLSTFQRIDFLGAISLGCANCALLFFFDAAQRHIDFFSSAFALVLIGTWLAFLTSFILIEAFWAREPIIPLRLIVKGNVLSSYSIQFLQTAAQMALFTSVPLYFRVSQDDTNTTAAIRLLFLTFGTMLGGLISGFAIKRTGRYKPTTILALVLSNISFLAILLRWRGSTGWLETVYGIPVGVGFGVSLSAAFVGLTAGLKHSEIAIATSGFYLSLNLGSLFGVSCASLLIQSFVLRDLRKTLSGTEDMTKIIEQVTSNLDNLTNFTGKLGHLVRAAYVKSLTNVWLLSLFCGCLALGAALLMPGGKLGELESEQEEAVNSGIRRTDQKDTESQTSVA